MLRGFGLLMVRGKLGKGVVLDLIPLVRLFGVNESKVPTYFSRSALNVDGIELCRF